MIRFCINYERGATDQPLDSDDENDQDERFERGTTWYSCDDKETFLDVCDKLDLTTDSERQRYFLWCKTEYNRGNDPLFKTKRHCLYVPNPMLGKKSKKANRKWTFQAGTQFPRPTHELWDKHVQKSTAPIAARTDHTQELVNLAMLDEAYEIIFDWELLKEAMDSDEPAKRLFEQVEVANLADTDDLHINWAKMDHDKHGPWILTRAVGFVIRSALYSSPAKIEHSPADSNGSFAGKTRHSTNYGCVFSQVNFC